MVEKEHANQMNLFLHTKFDSRNIYILSDSQESSLQTYTLIISLEGQMVETLTDLNWEWKSGSENIWPL